MSDNRPAIVVIDDDIGDAEILRRSLGEIPDLDFEFVHCTCGEAGRSEVLKGGTAWVFLDYELGEKTGLDVLADLRSSGYIGPIIVLTGHGDEHIAVEIMRAGADDYLTKEVLSPAVLHRSMMHTEARHLRRKAENELRSKNALLEEMLEREKQTIKKLEEATQKAEAANSAKSQFLARMSHELRTPMNSIIGFTETMMDDAVDVPTPKRARRLEKVHRNALHLLALLNDVLDLSKIEADRLVIEDQIVDVATSLNECLESARPLVKGKPVELQRQISGTIPPWRGDNLRLRQIVTNLLGNAVKFTESGTIKLRAEVSEGDLRIDVEDTGIGIAAADIARIFERFQQVDSSSTGRASGTGLGLAICRKLCKLMGGQISVRSTPGVGSCFTVMLPMARRDEETDPLQAERKTPLDPRSRRPEEALGGRT